MMIVFAIMLLLWLDTEFVVAAALGLANKWSFCLV